MNNFHAFWREPFKGIWQIENYYIDAVEHIMWVKAEETYRKDLIYVKVQMISKVSTAVKMYLNGIIQKREAKSGHRKILHLHQHYDAGTSIKTRKEYRLGKE